MYTRTRLNATFALASLALAGRVRAGRFTGHVTVPDAVLPQRQRGLERELRSADPRHCHRHADLLATGSAVARAGRRCELVHALEQQWRPRVLATAAFDGARPARNQHAEIHRRRQRRRHLSGADRAAERQLHALGLGVRAAGQVAIQSSAGVGGPAAWTTTQGQWEELRVCNNSLFGADHIVVYNQDPNGGAFYVDRVEVREIPNVD